MHILALDLSTTVVGYSILEKTDGSLIEMGYHAFEQKELIDRGLELRDLLDKILINPLYKIDGCAIEERLKSFRGGGTNANAMLNTAQLNYLCQYLLKFVFEVSLLEINVNTARSEFSPGFHKIARAQKGVKHKEIAFKMVLNQLGTERFPKKVLKSGPRKGEEVFIDEAMDMSDSYVIGKAAISILNKPEKKPVVKKVKKKKDE